MAELVYEDEQDEAEPELPASEPERVRREGDEEGEELREPSDHDRQADEPIE